MHNLAGFYATGGGVPRDLAKAYYWAMLALQYYPRDDMRTARLRANLKLKLEIALPPSAKKREAIEVLRFKPVRRSVPTPPARPVGLLAHEMEVAGLATAAQVGAP